MSFSFGFRSMYSPDDPIQDEILKEVGQAKKSIYMMIYGFHLPQLTDLLIKKHQEGIDVQCVLDYSQSRGVAERGEVQRMVDAGMDVTIGTSSKSHQIMHEKGIVIDGVHTMTGSYNFSLSAAQQVNHMDFVYSIDRANWFTDIFKYFQEWMRTNEPEKQPKKTEKAGN